MISFNYYCYNFFLICYKKNMEKRRKKRRNNSANICYTFSLPNDFLMYKLNGGDIT